MQVDSSRGRGEALGEISFFFRLRHTHTAVVGRSAATLFKLRYDDYLQLAATYADDAEQVLAAVIAKVEAAGGAGGSKASGETDLTAIAATVDDTPENAVVAAGANSRSAQQRVGDAIRRKARQEVAAFLQSAADKQVAAVLATLAAKKVHVNIADAHGRAALHVAASCGHTDLARELLEHGASPAMWCVAPSCSATCLHLCWLYRLASKVCCGHTVWLTQTADQQCNVCCLPACFGKPLCLACCLQLQMLLSK